MTQRRGSRCAIIGGLVALRVLALAVLSGCGSDPRAGEHSTIALVMKTRNNPFFIDMEKAARQAADRSGVRLLVSAADDDADIERQIEILETFLVRKVGAILLTPCGSKAVVPFILRANRAGVPVIIVDTRVDAPTLRQLSGHTATFIGSDNIAGGRLAGEYMGKLMGGKGSVAVIEGIAGHETGEARKAGFLEGIGKFPGIKVVASQTGEWDQERSYNVAQSMLLAHPDIGGIFACNDPMALGAARFIDQHPEYRERVKVIGFDASAAAREAMSRKGSPMVASVAQFPTEMGRIGVETALGLLSNPRPLPPEIATRVELVTP